jgi:hypothetical protein
LRLALEELSAQVHWFKKQLFGQKSERRISSPPKEQLFLGEQFQEETPKEEETQNIANQPAAALLKRRFTAISRNSSELASFEPASRSMSRHPGL